MDLVKPTVWQSDEALGAEPGNSMADGPTTKPADRFRTPATPDAGCSQNRIKEHYQVFQSHSIRTRRPKTTGLLGPGLGPQRSEGAISTRQIQPMMKAARDMVRPNMYSMASESWRMTLIVGFSLFGAR